jgi:hypothetical protein
VRSEDLNCDCSKADLEAAISKILDLLTDFFKKISRSDAVKDAASYLKNGSEQMLAYKTMIEEQANNFFGEQHAHLAQQFLMPLAELISKYEGTYEDREKLDRLAKEIVKLKQAWRSFPFCQEEMDRAINKAVEIYKTTHKASSLIECVNSIIRRYLVSYKSIPNWFCDLFTFFWNFRKFSRGKRKDFAPVELMMGKELKDSWVDLILDQYPYEKHRKGISLPRRIPGQAA